MASLGPLQRISGYSLNRIIILFVLFLTLQQSKAISLSQLTGLIFTVYYGLVRFFYADFDFSFLAFLFYGGCIIYAANLNLNDKFKNGIVSVFILGSLFCSFTIFYEWKTGHGFLLEHEIIDFYGVIRAVGIHGNPSASAIAVSLGLVLLKTYYSRINIIRLGLMFVLFLALFLTVSRGAILAVVLIFVLDDTFKRRWFTLLLYFVLALFLLGSFQDVLMQGRSFELSSDSAGLERLNQFTLALKYFKNGWFLGYNGKVDASFITAHNIYLELLAFTGIVGAILFVTFVASMVLVFVNAHMNPFRYAMSALIVFFFFSGMSHIVWNNILFWISIGFFLNETTTSYD